MGQKWVTCGSHPHYSLWVSGSCGSTGVTHFQLTLYNHMVKVNIAIPGLIQLSICSKLYLSKKIVEEFPHAVVMLCYLVVPVALI